jgi:Zn-finger protein
MAKEIVCEDTESGEWFHPIKKGFLLACCDCLLVHRVNFKVIKNGNRDDIYVQFYRDDKTTREMRKKARK